MIKLAMFLNIIAIFSFTIQIILTGFNLYMMIFIIINAICLFELIDER